MLHTRTGLDTGKKRGLPGFGLSANAYGRHFEGYTEYAEIDEKGGRRWRRIYTGIYYTPDMTKAKRIWMQIGTSLAWLARLVAFGWIATRDLGANSSWYTAFAQCAAVMGLMWTCAGMFNWLISPGRMTVGDRHSAFENLKRGTLAETIAFAAIGVCTLLYTALNRTDVGYHLLAAGGWLALGAVAFGMNRWIANVQFIETQSEETIPEDAVLTETSEL